MDWVNDIAAMEDRILGWYKELHRHPESSFNERWTSAYILEQMSALPNAEVWQPTATSVAVRIKGEQPGLNIALRAEIDALPVQEETDLDYCSLHDGMMHACGHDAHSAMLMGAAAYFSANTAQMKGDVLCIFQHAEEVPPGGAREIVATGIMDDIDFIFAQHLTSTMRFGLIDIKPGPTSSNSDLYEIVIDGKGGHASAPESAVDPVLVGAKIVDGLQSIISRQIAPQETAVVSNTVFQAGNPVSANIIPKRALLAGSVRTLTAEARETASRSITKIAQGIAEAYGAKATVKYRHGYDSIQNDPESTDVVRYILKKHLGFDTTWLPGNLEGEDFSAYTKLVPGCYIQLGFKEKGFDAPDHSPVFKVNEKILIPGTNVLVAVAKLYGETKGNLPEE